MALNETAYVHTKATIDITSPALDISCMARTISLTPSDQAVDISTQCNPGATYPGLTTWTFTAELLNSYDSVALEGDGLWNQLQAIAKTLIVVTIKPADAVVSSANPSASFSMYMPSIPFLNVTTLGDKTLIPLTATTVGAPTFATA